MKQVKRWHCSDDYSLDETEQGELVLYTDYVALEFQAKQLEEALRLCQDTMLEESDGNITTQIADADEKASRILSIRDKNE